jgi:hypothetical protein
MTFRTRQRILILYVIFSIHHLVFAQSNQWSWIAGSNNNTPQLANYGTKGVAAPANHPGGRLSNPVTWTDNNGNLWLFGGTGYASTSTLGYLND